MTFTQQLRAQHIPILQLDGGDAFQKSYNIAKNDREAVDDGMEVFVRIFNQMGLQAYNIGDRDLAVGIERLQAAAKKASFPFLSANLRVNGSRPFQGSTVVTVAGIKFGVIGVLTTVFVNKAKLEQSKGITITDPAAAVAQEITALRAQGAQVFVVLAHLNDGEIKTVAQKNPDVDFMLAGQTTRMQRVLKKENRAFVANAYMRGKYVSVFDLVVKNKGLEFVDRDARKGLTLQIARLKGQVSARERSLKAARKDKNRAGSIAYLERNLVQLKTELQETEMTLEDTPEPNANTSYLRWHLTELNTKLADEPKVAGWVTDYRKIHPDPTAKPHPSPLPAMRAPKPTPTPRGLPAPTKRPAPPQRPTRARTAH